MISLKEQHGCVIFLLHCQSIGLRLDIGRYSIPTDLKNVMGHPYDLETVCATADPDHQLHLRLGCIHQNTPAASSACSTVQLQQAAVVEEFRYHHVTLLCSGRRINHDLK